jgi:hypothetical protein
MLWFSRGSLSGELARIHAALIAGEASHMNGAQTVQDVLAIDPVWWDENGSQRLMRFDLAAQSTSWWKLLSYCQEKQIFVP